MQRENGNFIIKAFKKNDSLQRGGKTELWVYVFLPQMIQMVRGRFVGSDNAFNYTQFGYCKSD